jgi:crossover junction endodeoxyribonuclease RuvC
MKELATMARKANPAGGTPGRLARTTKSATPVVGRNSPVAPIRVLGIDPGTVRLGYGIVERLGPGRLSYVECGVISAPATLGRIERLGIIGQGLIELIAELRPHAVAIEEAFFGKNVQSTLALGEARGVSILVASQAGLPISGYAPSKVKNTIVGNGRATKEQIGFVVRSLLNLRRVPEADAADALAIAVCHARSFDFAAQKEKIK